MSSNRVYIPIAVERPRDGTREMRHMTRHQGAMAGGSTRRTAGSARVGRSARVAVAAAAVLATGALLAGCNGAGSGMRRVPRKSTERPRQRARIRRADQTLRTRPYPQRERHPLGRPTPHHRSMATQPGERFRPRHSRIGTRCGPEQYPRWPLSDPVTITRQFRGLDEPYVKTGVRDRSTGRTTARITTKGEK